MRLLLMIFGVVLSVVLVAAEEDCHTSGTKKLPDIELGPETDVHRRNAHIDDPPIRTRRSIDSKTIASLRYKREALNPALLSSLAGNNAKKKEEPHTSGSESEPTKHLQGQETESDTSIKVRRNAEPIDPKAIASLGGGTSRNRREASIDPKTIISLRYRREARSPALLSSLAGNNPKKTEEPHTSGSESEPTKHLQGQETESDTSIKVRRNAEPIDPKAIASLGGGTSRNRREASIDPKTIISLRYRREALDPDLLGSLKGRRRREAKEEPHTSGSESETTKHLKRRDAEKQEDEKRHKKRESKPAINPKVISSLAGGGIRYRREDIPPSSELQTRKLLRRRDTEFDGPFTKIRRSAETIDPEVIAGSEKSVHIKPSVLTSLIGSGFRYRREADPLRPETIKHILYG